MPNTPSTLSPHVLRRSVRVCFSAGAVVPEASARPGKNGFAGFPRLVGLGAFAQFDVSVRGQPDPLTGYLLDIHVIDKALHAALHDADVAGAYARGELPDLALARLWERLVARLPIAVGVRWFVSPFCSFEVLMPAAETGIEGEASTPAAGPVVLLRQRFDFAAAHRLHAQGLTDEQNRSTFGKCNNPRGHGHNYQFEPAVRLVPRADGAGFSLATLEALCERVLLDRFDHTNLNEDTQEFDQARGGLNPSVENIATVFFRLLAPEVAKHGATLHAMTVWETDRTCATVVDGAGH
jgi:6-pyruvoyltetrahydropterin/6-carboxytetrahydropterin synthase